MSIDSCQTEGRQCIAFPQREKESKERSTLRRAERSQTKRTERRPEGGEEDGVFFFALWGLVCFHLLKKAPSSMKEMILWKQS